ncbi:MAG: HPr family phosphocarrier protein [Deltaproteobacteria bacterium]|nr:HPr family phosphocarrier protein [Deltaproteobacteria bacterium]MBW2661209.1 HPr family phosphocarrier protein [Deltaproteobacteria bacterium]
MQKTVPNISFIEKARIFSHDYLLCCTYISDSNIPQNVFSKKLYSKLVASSQLLEDFLDFHGAKNNKNWYFYRELVASVRHLSISSYSYKHISNRLLYYELVDTEDFEREGELTFDFLTGALIKMAPVILDEALRLNIPVPKVNYNSADFPNVPTCSMLDYDIDDENNKQQTKHIVKIASEFIAIAGNFDQFSFYEPYDLEGLMAIVPDKINEVEVRRFEMLVHSLQSSFDTYVIHGGFRFGKRKLKQLRGYISIVFHLLQMMGRLLHFYERHLHEAGYKNIYKKVQDRLESIIQPEILLDRTVNYCFYYICHFLSTGKNLAQEILNENIEHSSITVGIPVKLGFHSRPSLMVAKIVQHYGGQMELCVGEDRFDASSVLDIQWAGGKIQKENITEVIFEGDVRALKDIEKLASINYGEDSMGKGISLPDELKYLR